MFASYALWAVGDALLLVILWRSFAARLTWRYPVFYTYIGFTLATSALRITILTCYGLGSRQYYYAYQLPNLVSSWLLLLVLFDVWKRIGPKDNLSTRLRIRPLIFAGTAIALIATRLLRTGGDPYYRYQTVILFAQMLTCIFVYMRACGKREFRLGKNLKGMLGGIALLVGLQGMNFAHLFFIGTPTPVFNFLLQFFYFLALSVFTYSLWSYEPSDEIPPDYRQRIDRVGEELAKAIRILVSPR